MSGMSFQESIEVTKIYSVAGMLSESGLLKKRPFCSPHHTISKAGLVGGGCTPRPGQISLAQHGVLFLDELTEFSRCAVESLRQPIESGMVTISRANFSVDYPARFLMIAASNPCPCGFFGDVSGKCYCPAQLAHKYLAKLSGPLLDRIDLHVRVKPVSFQDLSSDQTEEQETSAKIRARVLAAQEFAKRRQGAILNARLNVDDIKKFCALTPKAKELLKTAFDKLGMSARSYHRVLRVARTIADLAGAEDIEPVHVREAVMLRLLDKQTV
jgi:magnesium chelatase family protein